MAVKNIILGGFGDINTVVTHGYKPAPAAGPPFAGTPSLPSRTGSVSVAAKSGSVSVPGRTAVLSADSDKER